MYMPHARVLEHLQHVFRPQPRAAAAGGVNPAFTQPHPSRSPFHGLLVAGLIAAAFWAALALLIAYLR